MEIKIPTECWKCTFNNTLGFCTLYRKHMALDEYYDTIKDSSLTRPKECKIKTLVSKEELLDEIIKMLDIWVTIEPLREENPDHPLVKIKDMRSE